MVLNSPYKFAPPSFGPNSPVSGRIDENELLKRSNNWHQIISRAKHFTRNLSVPNAIKETMVSYCGQLTPIGGTEESKRVFNAWAENADYQTGSKSLWELNSELVGVLSWGDCLVTMPSNPHALPGQISARIKLIDPMQVETPPLYKDGVLRGGRRVVLGVVLDQFDIEIGYYVRKAGTTGSSDEDYAFVPRFDPVTGRFVSQLIRRPGSTFPGQVRSFPMTATCMNEINDLDKLCESAVHAGINKNLLAVMLKTSDPSAIRQTMGNIGADGKPIQRPTARGPVTVGKVNPGSVSALPPDTDPIVISHSGNTDLVASIKMNLQLIAAAVNIPYEILMSSFLGISFSGGKLSYDALFRLVYLWNSCIKTVWMQIYRWVLIEHYLLQGIIPSNEQLTCQWIGSALPDPNPETTAKANSLNISVGVDTRSAIVGRKGVDYESHLRQIRAEEELEMKILGYRLGDVAESATRSDLADDLPPVIDDETPEALPL